VSGILIGGEHRGHEKARLRKGVTILVATPGRLMDHLEVRSVLGFVGCAVLAESGTDHGAACGALTSPFLHAPDSQSVTSCVVPCKLRGCFVQNTASFNASNLSWLVLDEADRLLDLGFEAKLKAIIEKFDSRSSNADSPSASTHRRRTVLLSATLHPGLSVLAGLSLQNPVGVGFKAEVVDGQLQLAAEAGADGQGQQQGGKTAGAGGEITFELPQQLKQKYVEVDAKMRLVYLIGGCSCSRV
jgi:ATP-dependent RNA helicase DDX31/DBP7